MNELFRKEMPILAAGLREVHQKAPRRFNLAGWGCAVGDMQPDAPISECGFAGCAIGWKDRFIPDSPLRLDWLGDEEGVPEFGGLLGGQAVRSAYDLDDSELIHLFVPMGYPNGTQTTALEVAERIESVMANGFPENIQRFQRWETQWL